MIPHERVGHEIPGHQASPGPVRWRTCTPDFGRHRLERPESFACYSSLAVPHERVGHEIPGHRLEPGISSWVGEASWRHISDG